jgi:anaerobic selenocysteine-containing dehydrogenase
MGLGEPLLEEETDEVIRRLVDTKELREAGIGPGELSDLRPRRVGPPRGESPFRNGFFTPSGRLEFYSETLLRMGLDPLPGHIPLAEGSETPHLRSRHPLQLIIPPAHHFLNSSLGEAEGCIRGERRPYVLLRPEDAAPRGIKEGDLVRVFNDRGEIFRYAKLGERTLPGVAVSEGAWWSKFSPGRKGVNQITSERLTDLGRGATFHSNLVEVEKVKAGRGISDDQEGVAVTSQTQKGMREEPLPSEAGLPVSPE